MRRRNPDSLWPDPRETFTVTSDGTRYRIHSKNVGYQDLLPGWHIVGRGLSKAGIDLAIRKHQQEARRNPRRRNPRSFMDDMLDEQRKPKRYTILTNGESFEMYSRRVADRELKPGWFILASGVSEEQANAIIPRYAAKMEALHNPRRRNPTPPGQRARRLSRLLARAHRGSSKYSRSVQAQLYRATLGSVRPEDLRAEHEVMRRMKRENPFDRRRPAMWEHMTRAQRQKWNKGHWTPDQYVADKGLARDDRRIAKKHAAAKVVQDRGVGIQALARLIGMEVTEEEQEAYESKKKNPKRGRRKMPLTTRDVGRLPVIPFLRVFRDKTDYQRRDKHRKRWEE